MTISQELGRWIAGLEASAVPDRVRTTAANCLLHDLLIGLAGRPHVEHIQRFASEAWGTPGQATLLATGGRISAEGAAFANAALMNVRSQDDTHEPSVTHPGVPVIAAALAAAELADAGGADLLAAIVAGYEITGRIGSHCGAALSKRGLRAAAVLGVFGATAASARLLRLDASQTAHALGLATQMAGGTGQVWVEGGTEFTTQLGMCARNGLTAARLAAAGVTASAECFEGKSGFYRAYAGVTIEPPTVLAGLGTDWAIDDVTVKPSPVCAALQGPVALMTEMVRTHALEPERIAAVALTLSPFEATYPGIDNAGPIPTPAAAKMSAQFSLALAALNGKVTFADLAACDAPRPNELARKLRVIADDGLQQRRCRIDVSLDDGRTISGRIDEPVGRPDKALVIACAEGLMAETDASSQAIHAFADAVHDLANAPNLAGLFDAYSRLAPEGAVTASARKAG